MKTNKPTHIAQRGKSSGQQVYCRAKNVCRYGSSQQSAYVAPVNHTANALDTVTAAYAKGESHAPLKLSLSTKPGVRFDTTNLVSDLKTLYSDDIVIDKTKSEEGYAVREGDRVISYITDLEFKAE